MITQPSLFDTGIKCSQCNEDPGPGKNSHLWNGFLDADMNKLVCMNCKVNWYYFKNRTEKKNLISEMPVVIETYLLNHKA